MVSSDRIRKMLPIALVICTAASPTDAAAPKPKSLGDLTGPWELMVDDHFIETRSALTRRYHAFQKHPANPVLKPDRPHEGEVAYLFGTVLPGPDGNGFRMWYHTHRGFRNLYATSEDGINWVKPDLGIVQFNGSGANNIFIDRQPGSHLPIVIHTPWEQDPERRYKLIYYDYGRTDAKHPISGFYGAVSPDGIHWSEGFTDPILPDAGDIGNFVWDPNRNRYIGYAKIYAPVRGFRRRSIGFTSTTDFQHWPPTELILVPDEVDDRWVEKDRQHTDFYGLAAFPYESMYLGFLWVFRITDSYNDGTIHVELVSSRDAVRWKRQEGDRPPILRLGDAGSWDDGMIHTPTHPIVRGDTVYLVYGASDQTHSNPIADGWGNCAIGMATLRKDGFASLGAGSEIGSLTTYPIRGLEGALHINTDAQGGSIQVEILDEQGNVIPGYSAEECVAITQDGVDQIVRWRGHEKLPDTESPRKIRFQLQNASLFAFRVDHPVQRTGAPPPLKLVLDFEGDGEAALTDKAAADGRQIVRLHHSAKVTTEDAANGSGALLISTQTRGALEILDVRSLGEQFTLALKLKTSARQRPMRLFSSHRGTGQPTSGELIFDIDPRVASLRFRVNGQTVTSQPFAVRGGQYHHLAASYDRGHVTLYVDGRNFGEGDLLAGTAHLHYDRSVRTYLGSGDSQPQVGVLLGSNLRVGQDLEGRFVTHDNVDQSRNDYQLIGVVDDVVVKAGLPEFARTPQRTERADFIIQIRNIHKYGPGGAWGRGGWARSFAALDGTIYLQGDKKTTDGGKTVMDHDGPSLEEILRIPEGVIYNRPGLFLALDGATDLISPDLYAARAWRSTDGLRTLQEEKVTVRIPGGPNRKRAANEWYGFYFYRDMLQLSDGTLLTTMEGNLEQDKLKPKDRSSVTESTYMLRTIVVTSKDDGRTWEYLSTVAAPRIEDPVGEGFDESTILRLDDGRILCIMRTGHFTPLYACWSSDDGKTWTEPRYTGLERGCDPQLRKLADGRILLSWGQRYPPGSYLEPRRKGALVKFALSEDGGVSWQVATVGKDLGSSYSSIFEIEPNLIFCQVDGWFWHIELQPKGFRDSRIPP